MSQILVALLSGGGTAAAGGTAAIVRAAYRHGKAAGRAEVTLETLKHGQEQTGRSLDDIATRLARLEHNAPASRNRKSRKA